MTINNTITLTERSAAPDTPATTKWRFYFKSGGLYIVDDAGAETLLGAGGAGSDTDAIHDNVSGEIAAVTAKATPIGADYLLIEDSAASNAKKSITIADLDLAASQITSGTLIHERGGLEADVSAYAGLIKILSGATSEIKCNFAAAVAPSVSDDSSAGYGVGSWWFDTTANEAYVCTDAGVGAAVWKQVASGAGGGANTALSNLAAVAINTSLISDTTATDDLGSSGVYWRALYALRTFTQELNWNPSAATVTLATGVANFTGLSTGQRVIAIAAETGVTDQLDSFSNVPEVGFYLLRADVGDTITIADDGSNIFLLSGATTYTMGSNAQYVLAYWAGSAMMIFNGDLAAASHAHAASDITSGTLAHERGGLEFDASTITTGGLIRGASAGVMSILTVGTDGQVLTAQADGSVAWEAPAAGAGTDYICIEDQKTAGTDGGTFTSGAWRTRDLNTEASDAGGHASLSSNQITLAAGTYRCLIFAPANLTERHVAKLYNITDTADVLIGSAAYSDLDNGDNDVSIIAGRFTIASSKVFEVQHQCQSTRATFGFGSGANLGVVEVYTRAMFWKE